jgi:hypothetical protein
MNRREKRLKAELEEAARTFLRMHEHFVEHYEETVRRAVSDAGPLGEEIDLTGRTDVERGAAAMLALMLRWLQTQANQLRD